MKICYENLDKIRLGKNGLFRKGKVTYVYKEKCKNCGEPYLTAKQSEVDFCSISCSHRYEPTSSELIDMERKKNRKEEKTKRYLELLEKGKQHVLYERNTDLSVYYEVRRASYDHDVLEVKCAYCGEWFEPSKHQVHAVRKFINGAKSKYSTTFYCCPEHAIELKKELTKIKKEWQLNKQLESTDIELLLLPEIKNRQKYFKNLSPRKKLDNYMRSIRGSYKVYKMPTDPEERRLYEAERNRKHLEEFRKKHPKEFKLRRLLYYSRVRAKEKCLKHTITKDWLEEKTKSNLCELTKIEFDYDTTIQRNPFGPSIDRIDVSKGYTPDNCRIVIWAVNAGLGHYSERDLYRVCKAYLDFNAVGF
jgi:hypothetical protein